MDERMKKFLSSRDENILLLYGIRKSGKTSYIKNAIKNRKEKVLYYEMKNTNEKENFILFKSRLESISGRESTSKDFNTLFDELAKEEERIIIIIESAELLFKFSQNASEYIKNAAKVHRIVLTTSQADFVKDVCQDDKYLSMEKEVSKYYESFESLKALPYSKQLQFQLVFGSSEFVVSKIDSEESLKRNVRNLLLSSDSIISEYIEHELFEDLGKKSYAFLILSILKDRRMKYGDLVEETGQKYNGLLDKQLNILIDLGLIKKSYPINRKIDRKRVLYEINDNLLRFYFRFVYPNRDIIEIIGSKAFYEKYIEKELDDYFMGSLRTILADYLEKASLDGKDGNSMAIVGRYLTEDDEEEEIAIITETCHRIFSIFYDKRVDDEMLAKEKKKIKDKTKGKAEVGLFSTNGFTFPSDGRTYISLKDIFSLRP